MLAGVCCLVYVCLRKIIALRFTEEPGGRGGRTKAGGVSSGAATATPGGGLKKKRTSGEGLAKPSEMKVEGDTPATMGLSSASASTEEDKDEVDKAGQDGEDEDEAEEEETGRMRVSVFLSVFLSAEA